MEPFRGGNAPRQPSSSQVVDIGVALLVDWDQQAAQSTKERLEKVAGDCRLRWRVVQVPDMESARRTVRNGASISLVLVRLQRLKSTDPTRDSAIWALRHELEATNRRAPPFVAVVDDYDDEWEEHDVQQSSWFAVAAQSPLDSPTIISIICDLVAPKQRAMPAVVQPAPVATPVLMMMPPPDPRFLQQQQQYFQYTNPYHEPQLQRQMHIQRHMQQQQQQHQMQQMMQVQHQPMQVVQHQVQPMQAQEQKLLEKQQEQLQQKQVQKEQQEALRLTKAKTMDVADKARSAAMKRKRQRAAARAEAAKACVSPEPLVMRVLLRGNNGCDCPPIYRMDSELSSKLEFTAAELLGMAFEDLAFDIGHHREKIRSMINFQSPSSMLLALRRKSGAVALPHFVKINVLSARDREGSFRGVYMLTISSCAARAAVTKHSSLLRSAPWLRSLEGAAIGDDDDDDKPSATSKKKTEKKKKKQPKADSDEEIDAMDTSDLAAAPPRRRRAIKR